MFVRSHLRLPAALLVLAALSLAARAGDQAQWGRAWSRNMVSDETGLPDSFDPASGRNVKWSAELGTETHSSPVIAGGRVYIGTNNGHPRDPRQQGDRGVLMCFDEATGRFLWQLVVPKRTEDVYFDWPNSGIASPVTVEGDRVYVVNNRGVVMCLNAKGKAVAGADDPAVGELEAEVIWSFDLTSGAGIWSHDAAHSSILVHGDHLYLNTATGVDNTHVRIRTPDAPSLVVLDKHTGRLLAREREGKAPIIFHNTWSAPSLAEVNGRPLLFFAGGDGILYAFEPLGQPASAASAPPRADSAPDSGTASLRNPAALKKAWQFDFDPASPKTNVHRYHGNRRESPSNFYGMPVFANNRIYLAGGGDLWWGKNEAWLKCIDATGTGDVTTNGLVWSYPLEKHVLSTPAVYRGLAFIADCGRRFHCVDAETGKALWTHDIQGEAWASPLAVDGKVCLGTRSGTFYVFAASREKQVLSTLELRDPISATAAAANGVLYVATMTHLYALERRASAPRAAH